jgi:hypothetical protein
MGDDAERGVIAPKRSPSPTAVQEARRRPIHVEASVAALRQGFPWAAVVLSSRPSRSRRAAAGGPGRAAAHPGAPALRHRRRKGADKDRAAAAVALRKVEDAGMRDRLTAELALAGRPPTAAEPRGRARPPRARAPDTSGDRRARGFAALLRAHESETRVPEIELALGKSLEAPAGTKKPRATTTTASPRRSGCAPAARRSRSRSARSTAPAISTTR